MLQSAPIAAGVPDAIGLGLELGIELDLVGDALVVVEEPQAATVSDRTAAIAPRAARRIFFAAHEALKCMTCPPGCR